MTSPIDDRPCPLCTPADPDGVVVQAPLWRVVRAGEAGFPAFYRLIWCAHVAEMSDLPAAQRQACMELVNTIETLMRIHLRPDKVNLASLGNMVPHLHWHVIGRYTWDSHFPSPVWAAPTRVVEADRLTQLQARLPDFELALRESLSIG